MPKVYHTEQYDVSMKGILRLIIRIETEEWIFEQYTED